MAEIVFGRHLIWSTVEQLPGDGKPLTCDAFFDTSQFAERGFPFAPKRESAPYSWLSARSQTSGELFYVLAQALFVGYKIRHELGEPWLNAAVTTGTAAHPSLELATRAALLELIQVDAAMGHWYSNGESSEVLLDSRTASLKHMIERRWPDVLPFPRFFLLPSSDMPGFTVACTISDQDADPAIAVGQGISLSLPEAMHRALLEAVGVFGLAKLNLLENAVADLSERHDAIYDLDQNVAWYARRPNAEIVRSRFGASTAICASDLPRDFQGSLSDELKLLRQAFAETRKELVLLNITPPDVARLGIRVVRAWSPDLLPLSLPGAPTAAHRRFKAYGGYTESPIHPYP